MQGDISNAFGSTNRMAVLKAVRKHIPCLAPLCASQFVRDGTVAVTQERDENGKHELHYSVAKGAWRCGLLPGLLEQDAGIAGANELSPTCNALNLVRENGV